MRNAFCSHLPINNAQTLAMLFPDHPPAKTFNNKKPSLLYYNYFVLLSSWNGRIPVRGYLWRNIDSVLNLYYSIGWTMVRVEELWYCVTGLPSDYCSPAIEQTLRKKNTSTLHASLLRHLSKTLEPDSQVSYKLGEEHPQTIHEIISEVVNDTKCNAPPCSWIVCVISTNTWQFKK